MYNKTSLIQKKVDQRILYFKMESEQLSGSFKIRGISKEMALYPEKSNFVMASGGNAGLALATIAQRLEKKATIVVPETTGFGMRNLIMQTGAKLIVFGNKWTEADQFARDWSQNNDSIYMHPFEGEKLELGHASIVHELKEQMSEPDLIALSVGGGGLFSGIARGLNELGWTKTRILCMETEGAATMFHSWREGKKITLQEINTIASSLGASTLSDSAWRWSQMVNMKAATCTDTEALESSRLFYEEMAVPTEAACGACLSAYYFHQHLWEDAQHIVFIVCGGSNFNLKDLQKRL